MVQLTIDGKTVKARDGAYVLEAARAVGIEIPTLCHNDSLTPDGRCRLCMVEVEDRGRTRVVTSCLFPAAEGLKVRTDSPKVLLVRKMVLELLLARHPEAPEVRKLAAEHGVTQSRFGEDSDHQRCVLCGLCVRTCAEVVGVSALGFASRGIAKKVGTPFLEASETCIGCGACVFSCPTNIIAMKDEGPVRRIWSKKFEMQACDKCGRFFAPVFQLQWIGQKTGVPYEQLKVCPDCR